MRIACVQSALEPGDWQRNVHNALLQARNLIEQQHPDLILFPEAFPSYLPKPGQPAGETLRGPTVRQMHALAAEGHCLVLFGMIRAEPDGLHNSAILVDGVQVLGVYDKSHLYYFPKVALLNEQDMFVRGEGLGLFDTPFGRLGVMICHDGTYMELPRALVLGGADILCWLMNDGNVISWAEHYARWCLAPVAIANVVGDKLWVSETVAHSMAGGSCIVDGDGTVLARAPEAQPAALVADLDLAKWRSVRVEGEGMQAVYRVRRPDLYGALTSPYRLARPMKKGAL